MDPQKGMHSLAYDVQIVRLAPLGWLLVKGNSAATRWAQTSLESPVLLSWFLLRDGTEYKSHFKSFPGTGSDQQAPPFPPKFTQVICWNPWPLNSFHNGALDNIMLKVLRTVSISRGQPFCQRLPTVGHPLRVYTLGSIRDQLAILQLCSRSPCKSQPLSLSQLLYSPSSCH